MTGPRWKPHLPRKLKKEFKLWAMRRGPATRRLRRWAAKRQPTYWPPLPPMDWDALLSPTSHPRVRGWQEPPGPTGYRIPLEPYTEACPEAMILSVLLALCLLFLLYLAVRVLAFLAVDSRPVFFYALLAVCLWTAYILTL